MRAHRRQQAERETVEITLWPDCMDPFRVFQACQWTVVATMAGAYFSGIPATEIQATTGMLGIDTDDQLLADVRVMESAARPLLNRKT